MAGGETPIRVVVIDDDLVTRRLLQLHLTALGCESLMAGDGASGIALAVRERPDAVLLDIQLPDIDGLQACRQLREVRAAVQALGCPLACPFGALSFLALPVIPDLRITDQGLFDVVKQEFIRV